MIFSLKNSRMISIYNRNTTYLCVLAFVFYQCVNFLYFPVGVTFGDEERFIGEAITLSKTGEFWTFGSSRAWEMPLTAIVYSLFYDITQNEIGLIYSVRVFQSLLLIIQALLISKILFIIFNNKKAANIALFTMLFYPFFVFYQGLLLSENIFITLLIASFYYLYLWRNHGFKLDKYFILTIFSFTLSIYSKATLSFSPAIILTIFYLFNDFNIKRAAGIFLASIILLSLFIAPWWVRNYIVFDAFVPFTTTGAKNLYLGNNLNNKTGGNDQRVDWELDFTKQLSHSQYSELEINEAFKERAVYFMVTYPEKAAHLMYLKFKRFYNIFPNAPSFNKGYYKWIAVLSYGGVFFLFIFSVFYNFSYIRVLIPIYLLFGYFTVLHMIFIASLRYRLPLEPFMILLASQYVAQMHSKILNQH